VKKAAEIIW